MPMSPRDVHGLYTVTGTHLVALLLLFTFSVYVWLKARRNRLLYTYLAVAGTIMLWLAAKIFKTVAPNVTLRWMFIVLQFVGIELLGPCLLLFAYVYTRDKLPPIRKTFLLLIPPLLSLVLVATNPLHMTYYSYFDFYRSRFGPLAYFLQFIRYGYLTAGVIILYQGYRRQQATGKARNWANLFSIIALLPLSGNVYYVLFKVDLLPWIMPFRVFDYSPVAIALALILFLIPAVKYRFFDVSPISYQQLYTGMPQGIVCMDQRQGLYGINKAFQAMFPLSTEENTLDGLIKSLPWSTMLHSRDFREFAHIGDDTAPYLDVTLQGDVTCRVTRKTTGRQHLVLCFTDITELANRQRQLKGQNVQLAEVNRKLQVLAEQTKNLAIARTKTYVAQNVHDILGHSLTVVAGTAELAALEPDRDKTELMLEHMSELLTSGLNDLRNSFIGEAFGGGQTSLASSIAQLDNDNIKLELTVQGLPYELNSPQTEAVFRLCQEAVTNAIKHGKADEINVILRYKPDAVEVFALDNGIGCTNIVKSYGLSGIEERIVSLGGDVKSSSDGERGFTIHARIPRTQPGTKRSDS